MNTYTPNWMAQPERGSLRMMKAGAWIVKRAPRFITACVIRGICLYFWLTGTRARKGILQYQSRLTQWSGQSGLFPMWLPSYRQFVAFGDSIADRLDVWHGRLRHADIDVSDPDNLFPQMQTGRGQVLVGAHLGNPDVCRALSEEVPGMVLNILVHDGNAVRFNTVMQQNGDLRMRVIQVESLDIEVMMQLKQRVDNGEWLAIAGDRIPLHGRRIVEVDFLGHRAHIAQGPWLLAGLLQCPINSFFCAKHQGRYHMRLQRLVDRISWTRANRDEVITRCAQLFFDRLAAQCVRTPLQWFNFFPFWTDDA